VRDQRQDDSFDRTATSAASAAPREIKPFLNRARLPQERPFSYRVHTGMSYIAAMSFPMTDRFITLEEYVALPGDDLYVDEVSRGLLVREPRPGNQHGEIVAELTFALRLHLEQHPVGRVVTEAGFLLARSPLTIRGPDVAFIRADRVPAQKNPSFFDGAPDLAIEVVSPSNRGGELLQKIGEFLAAGTLLAWVVYPQTHTVVEHTQDGEIRIYTASDVLTAPALLPGFALAVSDIFI
jgi:Uma2 family endonuclease